MLSFKQYLLIEQDTTADDSSFKSPWKDPIKPSPLTSDPAIKFGELSPEYAPFLDIDQMSHQEIVDTYNKYNTPSQTPRSTMLQDYLSMYDNGEMADRGLSSEQVLERKAGAIRSYLLRDQQALQKPKQSYWVTTGKTDNPFFGYGQDDMQSLSDASKLKDKFVIPTTPGMDPGAVDKNLKLRRIWDAQTGIPTLPEHGGKKFGEPGYFPQGPMAPDYKGVLEPEHLRSIVKDSQGNAIPGPIIKPQRIEISPEAAAKVKVAIDPNRRSPQVGDQWGNNFLKQLQKNWEQEALQLKLQKENPITQMQDLIKDNDQRIKAPGDLDLDNWSKEYDKFETKLPVDAAKEQQGFKGKDVSTSSRGKQVLGKLTQPLPGSSSPLISAAAKFGAGVVGALAGEYIVKPAAEKVGFFKAIESGTRAALSNSPDWVAKVADPALGAAQFYLDPLTGTANAMSKGFADKQKQDDDMMIKAGRPIGQRIIPSMKQ
jgi:hypothetical protein